MEHHNTLSELSVEVGTAARYEVLFRSGLLRDYGALCRDFMPSTSGKLVVLSDERVMSLYSEALLTSLKDADLTPETIVVPEGERSKSLSQFERTLDTLARMGMDRRGLLINFGGGVISDLGGFVASAYMRGIAYANLSTSLIGQLDASIGGKVAVNSEHAKNLIGAFHHPVHVAGDPLVLETLGVRDLRSGIAEAIKVAIISCPELFDILEDSRDAVIGRDPEALTRIINLAAQEKIRLVGLDPYEEDLRRPLNFGHTLGHPIETEFSYRKVRHGEAVAVGMAVATLIASARGEIETSEVTRILELLEAYGLIDCTPPIHADLVLKHLRYVQLIRGNKLHFVLPTCIGNVRITDALTTGELLQGFADFETLRDARKVAAPRSSR